jgi:hypothetical protein
MTIVARLFVTQRFVKVITFPLIRNKKHYFNNINNSQTTNYTLKPNSNISIHFIIKMDTHPISHLLKIRNQHKNLFKNVTMPILVCIKNVYKTKII